MQMAAFSAKCPYEIGDRVVVIEVAGTNENGVMYTQREGVITDIACTHYIKTGKIIFTYELNGSGKYERIMTIKEVGLTVSKSAYLTQVYKIDKYTCVRLCILPIENILAQVYNKDIIKQENKRRYKGYDKESIEREIHRMEQRNFST